MRCVTRSRKSNEGAPTYSRPMGRLENKVAIVTGAGSGIGEATARLMAREGGSVVVADINGTEAERVTGELAGAVAAEVDVSDESSVVRMVETAVESFGGLDVLRNNATDSATNAADTDIVTLDMAVFDRLVAVNLKGQFMGCKYAIPHMLARGGGSIVNTASIDGFVGRGVRAAYGASKAGVVLLTNPWLRNTEHAASGATPSHQASHSRPGLSTTRPRSTSKRHSRSIQCRDSAPRRMSPTPSSSLPRRKPRTSTRRRSWSTAARLSIWQAQRSQAAANAARNSRPGGLPAWSIYGAQRAQPVATGGKWDTPENRSNRPIRNRWQPTATVPQRMVRRGSTVRVVRGLCKSPARRGFCVQNDLRIELRAMGMEPFMEAFKSRTLSRASTGRSPTPWNPASIRSLQAA
jgi:NAD(P)-dependent dehydrogenase (short-subunit alcohol dehydrogenase family)